MSVNKILASYLSGKPVLLWRGQSELEPGQEVAVTLDYSTTNAKTGPMHQLSFYNVQPDDYPYGSHNGAGCGRCPLSDCCYVLAGPGGRFNLLKRRSSFFDSLPVVPSRSIKRFIFNSLRVGNYGDGASVPADLLIKWLEAASGHTGYTHFWRECDQRLSRFLMASVEDLAGAREAESMGWRYYLAVPVADKKSPLPELKQFLGKNRLNGSLICPHYKSQLQCISCLLCKGSAQNLSIIAPVHGALSGRFPVVSSN